MYKPNYGTTNLQGKRLGSGFLASPLLYVGLYLLGLLVFGYQSKRLPDNFSTIQNLQGEVSLFELIEIDEAKFPLQIEIKSMTLKSQAGRNQIKQQVNFSTLADNSLTSRFLMDLFLKYANIKGEYWEKLKLVFGSEAIERTFWVDQKNNRLIGTEPQAGKQWLFPFGKASKQNYFFWESLTGSELEMKYLEETKQDGLHLYRYQAQIGTYDLGTFELTKSKIGQRVRLDATGYLNLDVDKYSGLIRNADLELSIFAQTGIIKADILNFSFEMTEDSQAQILRMIKKINLIRWVLIYFAPLVWAGLYMVIIGRFKSKTPRPRGR